MGIKGKIASLKTTGIRNSLSPDVACIREAAHFGAAGSVDLKRM